MFLAELVIVFWNRYGLKSVIEQAHVPEGFLSFNLFSYLQSFLQDHYLRDWLGNYGDDWYTFHLM